MIVLGVIGWAMLRYSRKLPIAQFFAYSSALIAVLAVVLAGKGVAALQEAGIIDIAPLANFPRIAILGIFPSVQVVVAQLLALAVIAIGFWLNGRRSREIAAAERSEEHTSELQSLMRISYAVFCLKKKTIYSTPCSHIYL